MLKQINNETLKIAIPKNERLSAATINILIKKYKLPINFNSKKDFYYTSNEFGLYNNIALLMMREKDIPKAVNESIIDIGFAGLNTIVESEKRVMLLDSFKDVAACKVVAAVPNESNIQTLEQIKYNEDLVIYTSYPNTAKNFATEDYAWKADINFVSGGVERFARLSRNKLINNDNAIIEIVETGNSLKENNYRIVDELFNSNLVMFGNTNIIKNAYQATGLEIVEATIPNQQVLLNDTIIATRISAIFLANGEFGNNAYFNLCQTWQAINRKVNFDNSNTKFKCLAL